MAVEATDEHAPRVADRYDDEAGPVVAALRRRLPAISPTRYRQVLVVALGLIALIIFTGALVRLSGSGLGCPEWPSCSLGKVLRAPNDHGRIELFNRYLTGWIAVAVVVLGLTSIVRKPYRRSLVHLSLLLLVGVVGQALLGGLTVLLKLKPQAVMGHFLLSIALLSAALILHDRATQDTAKPELVIVPNPMRFARWVLLGSTACTVVLGTVVTSSGPHGGDDVAERFRYSMRDVARLHSGAAWIAVLSALIIGWTYRRPTSVPAAVVQRRISVLFAALIAQGAVGYLQYLTRVPAWLVAVHILGVVAIWVSVMRVFFSLRSAASERDRAADGVGTVRGSPIPMR